MGLKRVLAGAAAAALLTGAYGAAAFEPSAEVMRGHMQFLASDLLQGRGAGTTGYDVAATYVAAEFAKLGLKPAGDDGSYLQRVQLTTYWPASQGSIVLSGRGGATPLVFGTDYVPGTTPLSPSVELNAPLVFAGYGVSAPERGRDDYAGLDVRGKIVVVLQGAPTNIQTEERAHYRSGRVKRQEAEKRGAVGVIFVETPTARRVSPWSYHVDHWQDTDMTWAGADGRPFSPAAGAPEVAMVSLEGAQKLFAGAPASVEQIMAAAARPDGVTPRFPLPSTARVSLRNQTGQVLSSNVAGLIEGQRTDEIMVLSAHLDGVGVDEKREGPDKIGNGAMDNASGIATMLEVARGFTESGRKPRRSVLLLAVTAEEKGLVGADYFARNPTVPKSAIVANVNLDMPILSYDFTDVVAFGAERSSIGPAAQRAAAKVGLKLSPDPLPEQGLFTRSDHYRFVEQGVPSVFFMTGHGNGGAQGWDRFLKERYHKATDDMAQPIDWKAAARFAKVNYELARELADAPERPRWNRGDFFGTLFGGSARAAP